MSNSKVPAPPKLGPNILKLRKDKKLSLDTLAERSGVSKAMLSQVEQEKTNPTIATVWKIAHGLDVPLEELLGAQRSKEIKFEMLTKENIPIIYNDKKTCKFSILSTVDMRDIEIYMVELKKSGILTSTKHFPDTEEILYVTVGAVEVKAGEKSSIVKAGDTIKYHADINHSIKNISGTDAKFFMVVRVST